MQRDSGAEDPVAGGGGHVLALAPEGQGVDLADASAQLCLVGSGKWLGFWSPVGGGRFLQVRKRGLQKLCFFNANFGTWEQWEVVGREPPEGWGQADVCLANRRLPNFVISFTVLRVPEEAASHAALRPPALPEDSAERVPESSLRARVAASPSASASPPPARAGVGPSEAAAGPGGKHVMNAMSDMMVQEWTSFVTREVESRKYVERQLKLVSEGMQIIRTEVAGQVLDVRTRMRAEVKEAMLRCLVQQRRFWMAIRGHRIMRSAWRVWWKRVRSSRLVVSDARKFYLSYLVSKCLNAWVARCGKRRQVTNMARALVLRQTFSLRSATWEAWKCQVGIRQRYLRNFRAICQRADWFAVRSTFTAWWDRIIRVRRVRGVLRRMDSRLTFGRSSQAFNSWLQVCESAEAGRRLKMELLLKWKSPTKARLRSCFAFWAWHSAVQARRVRLLARAYASRIHRVLCKVFLNWGELVAQQAGQSFALAAHLEQTRAVVTARFFRAWSWAARYHSRLRSAMHRFALKSSRTWLRLAFLRWSEFVGDVMSVHAGAFKSARRCNVRRLSSALHSWQEEALRSRTERQTIYNVFRRMGAWRLRNFFRAWEQDARFQTSSRTFALRALHRWQRSRALRHCFYSLMAAAQEARTCRFQLMKAAKFCYQGITRRSFYGWAEAVEEAALERMQVLCLISRVSGVLSRFSFMYWREAVVKKRRQRLAVSRAKWKRGAACMHTVLKAWRIYSSTTNLSRKKVMRTALFRARSAAAASFDEWHAWVERKSSERRVLQQGRRRVNKVVLRTYFDRLVQVVHWKEKELTLFGCLGRKVEKIAQKGGLRCLARGGHLPRLPPHESEGLSWALRQEAVFQILQHLGHSCADFTEGKGHCSASVEQEGHKVDVLRVRDLAHCGSRQGPHPAPSYQVPQTGDAHEALVGLRGLACGSLCGALRQGQPGQSCEGGRKVLSPHDLPGMGQAGGHRAPQFVSASSHGGPSKARMSLQHPLLLGRVHSGGPQEETSSGEGHPALPHHRPQDGLARLPRKCQSEG